jgi:hypothetical protein
VNVPPARINTAAMINELRCIPRPISDGILVP